MCERVGVCFSLYLMVKMEGGASPKTYETENPFSEAEYCIAIWRKSHFPPPPPPPLLFPHGTLCQFEIQVPFLPSSYVGDRKKEKEFSLIRHLPPERGKRKRRTDHHAKGEFFLFREIDRRPPP